MRVKEVRDTTGRPNTLSVVYHPDGMVHVQIVAKHGGDTQVASAVSMPRVLFADLVRGLGVM